MLRRICLLMPRYFCYKSVDRKFICSFSVLCFVTFLIILPTICLRLHYSLYHHLWPKQDVERQREAMRQENNKRLKEADTILQKYRQEIDTGSYILNPDKTEPIDVGVTVITVSRNRHRLGSYEPKYLTQVITTFLRLLSSDDKLKLKYDLFICNVDTEPDTYFEVHPLSKIVKTFNIYSDKKTLPVGYNQETATVNEKLEKEKIDYLSCGEKTMEQNVSNVFLVEDDALPHPSLFPVLEHVVQSNILGKNTEIPHHKRNVTFVKFYHPDRLLSYISIEWERLPELFSLSAIFSMILTVIYQKLRPVSKSYSKCLWFSLFLYSCSVFLLIGRQHLMEMRRMSKYLYQVTPAPSCCTPANLYTKQGMKDIVHYLKGVTCREHFGKDTAIDKFRATQRKNALMVQPNLFTHIGMYSSLRNIVLNPNIV